MNISTVKREENPVSVVNEKVGQSLWGVHDQISAPN